MPQLELNAIWLARAIGAAAIVGGVTGALWGFVVPNTAGLFSLLIGAGIGYCVGESVSVATNRKVGTPLQVISALGVVLAYFAHNLTETGIDFPGNELWDLLSVVTGIVVAVGRLRF